MEWGAKGRFHDLDQVIAALNPKAVEFHLTDEDVKKVSDLDVCSKTYPIDYSIHLPEYWEQVMIDPCNLDELKKNMEIYKACIEKGLNIKNNFVCSGKLKVILHPGASTVDPLPEMFHQGDIEYPKKFYVNDLYLKFRSFTTYLMMIPAFKDSIEILVENMPPLPWFYGGQYYSNIFCDPKEIVEYCKKYVVGFCLDISHLGLYCNYTGQDLIESVKLLKPYVRQIHIADASGTDGEGASIGEGNIDFESVMQELKDLNVAVIPETMWGHKSEFAGFKQVIKVCSQYL